MFLAHSRKIGFIILLSLAFTHVNSWAAKGNSRKREHAETQETNSTTTTQPARPAPARPWVCGIGSCGRTFTTEIGRNQHEENANHDHIPDRDTWNDHDR